MLQLTRHYIKLHIDHLYEIEMGLEENDLDSYSSLYDHMYAFFIYLGLGDEKAQFLINDFRQNSST